MSKVAGWRDIEDAIRLIVERTADGEPLWGWPEAPRDQIPTLLIQDVRMIRRHMWNGGFWRHKGKRTLFLIDVANTLATRYPERVAPFPLRWPDEYTWFDRRA